MKTYTNFLKNKEVKTITSGFELDISNINEALFDWQKQVVKWAIKKGKAAIFADCGLGKTLMQLEWAVNVHRYTNKPVLILAPLAVSKQTRREGIKFGIEVQICESYSDVINGVNIINYEKLEKIESNIFSGVVLDEIRY